VKLFNIYYSAVGSSVVVAVSSVAGAAASVAVASTFSYRLYVFS
jgi:hypothetical protein